MEISGPIPGSALSLCNHPFGAAASSGGGPGCHGGAGGVRSSLPSLPWLLGNASAADSRRRVVPRGQTALPEALSAAEPGLGNTWPGGTGRPRGDPGRTKQPGGDAGRRREDGSRWGFPKFFRREGCFPGNNASSWLPVALPGILGGLWRENSFPLHPAQPWEEEVPLITWPRAAGGREVTAVPTVQGSFEWQIPLHARGKGSGKIPRRRRVCQGAGSSLGKGLRCVGVGGLRGQE